MIRITLLLLGLTLVAAQTQLRGVNYGIQKPDGSCTAYADVLADFQKMATFAQAVKIYNMGFCNGAENSIIAARATGLKLFLGMAAGPPDAFQNELSIIKRLGSQYGFGSILGVTVGSEDLYRQSIAASTIANYIQQVQAAIKQLGGSIPVTHTDVYYLQPAEILAVEDIVMFNAFTFWEGQPIDNALNVFISHYQSVVQAANGKPVWIGESGWPSGGTTQASAVANSDNAGRYLREFVCWANANGVPYFYFEAFNEPWKGPDQNGDIEVNFGIYNADRSAKSYSSFTCPGSSSSTTSSPASTTPSQSCTDMFASTTCRTSSENPSQVDASSVSNARGWLCSNYAQFCTEIQTGGKYASCNNVEQISYAMSQYYNTYKSSQGNQACDFSGLGHIASGSTPAASSTTSANTPKTSSTTSANAPATSSASPATSSSGSNNCQTMFSGLSCSTSSEDPSQVDSSSVNNARGWLCGNYPQFCTEIQTGGKYASCNSVEQISYAMSQYYNANKATQGDQACNFNGLGHVTGNTPAQQVVASTTSANAPKTSSTTSANATPASSSTTRNTPATSSTTSNAPAATSSGDTCQKASYCAPTLCACSGACYDTNNYCCPNGQLTQKIFC